MIIAMFKENNPLKLSIIGILYYIIIQEGRRLLSSVIKVDVEEPPFSARAIFIMN